MTGLLTAADLSHEPEDGLRRELHDGVVLVVPLVPGEKADLTAPWPLTVDMAELVMPHKR